MDKKFQDILDYLGVENYADYGNIVIFENPNTQETAYFYPNENKIEGIFSLGLGKQNIDDIHKTLMERKNNASRAFKAIPGMSFPEFKNNVYNPLFNKYIGEIKTQSNNKLNDNSTIKSAESAFNKKYGSINDIYRGYEKNNKTKTYHPHDSIINDFSNSQYFKDNKMSWKAVPISDIDIGVLGDRPNFEFDHNKNLGSPIYGTNRNGRVRLNDGKHRTKALKEKGYTHIYMPIIEK